MESANEKYRALAQLAWQVELGACDAISDEPQSWYEMAQKPAPKVNTARNASQMPPNQTAGPRTSRPVMAQPVEVSQSLAQNAKDLAALRSALEGYGHCVLRQGAKNMVFSDGNPKAQTMIIGEAPGRDEDIQGKPFVGAAGQMLDKMFAAIGLSRRNDNPQRALYITNVIPWRPPANRDPNDEEIAMMLPFVQRHIKLIEPKRIILVGNIACSALLGLRGITKLRGHWHDIGGTPVMPMLHPAYVLRRPDTKRDVWQDLKSIRQHLNKEA